jgi:hypothetical protein
MLLTPMYDYRIVPLETSVERGHHDHDIDPLTSL